MARRIEPTPILKGEDAKLFRTNLRDSFRHALTPSEKIEKEIEKERMKRHYDLMSSMSNGQFY